MKWWQRLLSIFVGGRVNVQVVEPCDLPTHTPEPGHDPRLAEEHQRHREPEFDWRDEKQQG